MAAPPPGFSALLLAVTIIVAVMLAVGAAYVLVAYQHPDDVNQAWFPKAVVVLAMWLCCAAVLLFPLDVANRAACGAGLLPAADEGGGGGGGGGCRLTLPMRRLWHAAFFSLLGMAFVACPFTLFFYEGDSDYSLFVRIRNALVWTLLSLFMISLVIGIAYGLAGFVDYPTLELVSGLAPISALAGWAPPPQEGVGGEGGGDSGTIALISGGVSDTPPGAPRSACILPGAVIPGVVLANPTSKIKDGLCTAFSGAAPVKTWTLRVSLPVYCMALQSVIGWILFLVFGGWGMLAGPVDWVHEYGRRPRSVITKSQYLERARGIAQRAREIRATADMLKRQDRASGGAKTRTWRGGVRRLQREVVALEADEAALDASFPQGADGEARWVVLQLSYLATLLGGLVGLGVSLMWIAHVVVYMLPPVPLHPLLNEMFVKMDAVFPLFGVAFFSLFTFYLLVVTIKGNFLLGLGLSFFTLYPVRKGATMMSSFLVNLALVMAAVPAVVQFAASAFAGYAHGTAVFDVFGNTAMFLRGLSYVYRYNVFLYMLLGVCGLSGLVAVIKGPGQGWVRKKKEDGG